ncbi:hypothetical protein EDM57_04510 [Brevibacillus gelatini]|uniref:Uncharacterized protein n=1 Tax=Brevibacillus gelatini TaxID=1655277 RepID=A0A3M8B7Q3_9BACL|nr:hypothetical protein [Brevibacillus gelatini]RNB59409.1 hypothetical protein EDM57_04510 [Brevibacillus gelatini]
MPILSFPCPKCNEYNHVDYTDYEPEEAVKENKGFFEEWNCKCGKKMKTVVWVAVVDDDEQELITTV